MRVRSIAALGAVTLLAACGGEKAREGNGADTIMLENEAMVVPEANIAVENAAIAAEPETKAAVNLAPDGLSLVLPSGSARHLTFGVAREQALTGANAVLGEPIEQGENQECGAGTLGFAHYRGGLALYFQAGEFVGWDLDGREGGTFSTASGIGIGSTRQEIESSMTLSVEDTSLGIEFMAGGLSGLLSERSPAGRVINLWAGATCIAR